MAFPRTVGEVKRILAEIPDDAPFVGEEKYEPMTSLESGEYDDYAGAPTGKPITDVTLEYRPDGKVWVSY